MTRSRSKMKIGKIPRRKMKRELDEVLRRAFFSARERHLVKEIYAATPLMSELLR